MPSQMKYSYPYGDKTIVFEKDELQKIKCFDPPGLRVMGFKPRSKLKQWQNLRSSSFIYPDDSTIRGSVTAFAALFQKMVELDKIAIARFTPRVNTPPKFCALLPQVERVDDDTGDVLIPNGFVVIYLPYLDDYRELDVEDGVVDPSPEQVCCVVSLLNINSWNSRRQEMCCLFWPHFGSIFSLSLFLSIYVYLSLVLFV